MEFDKSERRFRVLRNIHLSSVPTAGDKVVIDIEGIGYVFKVYDVHYGDNEKTDIYVIRQSTITEYNSSKFPDIV